MLLRLCYKTVTGVLPLGVFHGVNQFPFGWIDEKRAYGGLDDPLPPGTFRACVWSTRRQNTGFCSQPLTRISSNPAKMSRFCPNPYSAKSIIKHYIRDLKRYLSVRGKKKYEKLEDFKYHGKEKKCFVLANGPSVKKLDGSKLKSFKSKGWDIFCVNYFPLSGSYRKAEPNFWVLSDPYSFKTKEEKNKKVVNEAKKHIKKVFVPERYKKVAKEKLGMEVVPFCDVQGSHIFSKSIDPRRPRSYMSMTAYKALALAVHARYQKIYICGFDNTYIRMFGSDRDNKIYRTDKHFSKKSYPKDESKDMWLEENVEDVSDVLFTYSRLFRDLKKFRGNDIVNLDVESLTDAFPKSDDLNVYE